MKDGDNINNNDSFPSLIPWFMLLSYLIFNDPMWQLPLFYRCGNLTTERLSSELHIGSMFRTRVIS